MRPREKEKGMPVTQDETCFPDASGIVSRYCQGRGIPQAGEGSAPAFPSERALSFDPASH